VPRWHQHRAFPGQKPITGEVQNPIHIDRVLCVRFHELKCAMIHGADQCVDIRHPPASSNYSKHAPDDVGWSPKMATGQPAHYMRSGVRPDKVIYASDWPGVLM